ncbi:MAG: prepilin-type N-terminal cleavage/methylation domain-containing protein [Gammaproteobacteria bacterium]|nr:prepilin-type N-terminal cleavage/methylation domain-containing protein [Gammaproteobacteria bacterium]
MSKRRNELGLTLVEVLVSMVLLSILLIPAVSALQVGIVGSEIHSDVATSQSRLTSQLEQLLAEPFADLAAAATAAGGPTSASSYSEPAGPTGRVLVYLSFYDGDNADADDDPFTGTEEDLLWIRVDLEDTIYTLQTITARGYQ